MLALSDMFNIEINLEFGAGSTLNIMLLFYGVEQYEVAFFSPSFSNIASISVGFPPYP